MNRKQLTADETIKLIIALIVGLALLSGMSSCRVTNSSVTSMKVIKNKFSKRSLKKSMRYSTWEYEMSSKSIYSQYK